MTPARGVGRLATTVQVWSRSCKRRPRPTGCRWRIGRRWRRSGHRTRPRRQGSCGPWAGWRGSSRCWSTGRRPRRPPWRAGAVLAAEDVNPAVRPHHRRDAGERDRERGRLRQSVLVRLEDVDLGVRVPVRIQAADRVDQAVAGDGGDAVPHIGQGRARRPRVRGRVENLDRRLRRPPTGCCLPRRRPGLCCCRRSPTCGSRRGGPAEGPGSVPRMAGRSAGCSSETRLPRTWPGLSRREPVSCCRRQRRSWPKRSGRRSRSPRQSCHRPT